MECGTGDNKFRKGSTEGSDFGVIQWQMLHRTTAISTIRLWVRVSGEERGGCYTERRGYASRGHSIAHAKD